MEASAALCWKEVRRMLSVEVCCALGWQDFEGRPHTERASWGTQAGCSDSEFCELSVVSDTTRPVTHFLYEGQRGTNTIHTVSAQMRFESEAGEGALELANETRHHFTDYDLRRTLRKAGISILQDPSPARKTPYLAEGVWIDTAILEILFTFQETRLAGASVVEARSVAYEGLRPGSITIEGPVFDRTFSEAFA